MFKAHKANITNYKYFTNTIKSCLKTKNKCLTLNYNGSGDFSYRDLFIAAKRTRASSSSRSLRSTASCASMTYK